MEENINKYITPLGVITENDTEESIKNFFGLPDDEVVSGNAKNIVYYCGTMKVNIIFLRGRIKGVIVEDTDATIKRKLSRGDSFLWNI